MNDNPISIGSQSKVWPAMIMITMDLNGNNKRSPKILYLKIIKKEYLVSRGKLELLLTIQNHRDNFAPTNLEIKYIDAMHSLENQKSAKEIITSWNFIYNCLEAYFKP